MFKNREEAAEKLLEKLSNYNNDPSVVIAAIPRGALRMGKVIAQGLNVPLDVVLTKKIGAPINEEFAIGAVSLSGYSLLPEYGHYATNSYVDTQVEKLQKLLQTRYYNYKSKSYNPQEQPFYNKTVILVDDGIATGQTFIESVNYIRKQQPLKIIAATPIIPQESLPLIRNIVDDCIYLFSPIDFYSVSQFYDEFPQVSDEEAITILRKANL
jgi:predicted phosphoribosyltransferase